MSDRPYLSIGEVLGLLLEEFPDVTISKIRFLEAQGLIDPERTASGYRKFYDLDVERLRFILREQKDHYLPLKVIRDRLDSIDYTLPNPPRPIPSGASWLTARGDEESVTALPSESRATSREWSARPAAFAELADHFAESEPRRSPRTADPAVEQTSPPGSGAVTSGESPGEYLANVLAPQPQATNPPSTVSVEMVDVIDVVETTEIVGSSEVVETTVVVESIEIVGTTVIRETSVVESTQTIEVHSVPVAPVPVAPVPVAPVPVAPVPPAAVPPAIVPPTVVPEAVRASGSASVAARLSPVPAAAEPTVDVTIAHSLEAGEVTIELTADELCGRAGISPTLLKDLVGYGLIAPRLVSGLSIYGLHALRIATTAGRLAEHGLEPRHLRSFRTSVDREIGLIEQLVQPLLRQRNPHSRAQAAQRAEEVARLGGELRSALIRLEIESLIAP